MKDDDHWDVEWIVAQFRRDKEKRKHRLPLVHYVLRFMLWELRELFIVQALFGPLLVLTLPITIVAAGVLYGLMGFLATGTLAMGGLAYYVNRKVGVHLQFVEYNFWLRLIALIPAFLLFLLILFGLVFLSNLFR